MGTGQVGPAYQSEESEGRRGGGERKVAALRRELEELRSRMDNLGTELVVRSGEGSQLEWRSAVEKVEARVRGVEEMVESNSQRVERVEEMCRAKSEVDEEEGSSSSSSSSSSATVMGIREELRRVEARLEEREQESRKYFLIITKLRRTRRLILIFQIFSMIIKIYNRLERPAHVIGLVTKFFTEQLKVSETKNLLMTMKMTLTRGKVMMIMMVMVMMDKVDGVDVEEAYRVDGDTRPQDVRVRLVFSSSSSS